MHMHYFLKLSIRFNAILQVPLGVQLLSDNKTNQTSLIMRNLHKYVPKKTYKVTYHLDEDIDHSEECYHCILFDRGQLIVCHAYGEKFARTNDNLSDEQFYGL